jgi:uncharacterized lipoprotein YddW (UPF0748 family)
MSFVALLTIALFRQGLSPTCSKFSRRSRGCLFLLVALGLGFVSGCGEDSGADSSTPADLPGQPAVDAAGGEPGEPARAPALFEPYRAMWVLCEGSQRALEDPVRVEALVERARALGVSDLFVQVYRGGRAWYDSTRADAGPYRELLQATGVDTLRQLLTLAHAEDIRVHAWVNVLSLSLNSGASLLDELGREAVLVDRRGRSILNYPGLEVPPPDVGWYRMGTRGVYLDPAAPGVSERLAAIFAELVERYPKLDGLHLDYIRHPGVLPFVPGSGFGVGLDFGYGAASIERFQRETGLRGPYRDPLQRDPTSLVNTRRWDAWRREKVSELVARIRETALGKRPGLLVSAAVNSYGDRAYLSLQQDWRRWLEDGLLDFAVPMIYTRDDRMFRYQVEAFASGRNADRIWMGVGSWLFAKNPERALGQLDTVRAAGSTGEALFSYDSLVEAPELYQALVARNDPAERETSEKE